MNLSRPFAASALLLTFAASAAVDEVVTSVSAVAQPESYVGECPAPLEFMATIKVSQFPVVVEYRWDRSDGSHTQVRRIQVRRGVQQITDEWGVAGVPGKPQSVWNQLKILSPTSLSAAAAKATVSCQ